MGSRVRVRLETLQGEVLGAGAWTEMLVDADGIVFVADSSPRARTSTFKALSAVQERLGRSRGPTAAVPALIQWNKRDLHDARSLAELEAELNHRCLPSVEASALRGRGVAETLIEILKRTLIAAHPRWGGEPLSEADLGRTLAVSIQKLSHAARAASTRRYGATIEPLTSGWRGVSEPVQPGYEGIQSREVVFSGESPDEELKPIPLAPRPPRVDP